MLLWVCPEQQISRFISARRVPELKALPYTYVLCLRQPHGVLPVTQKHFREPEAAPVPPPGPKTSSLISVRRVLEIKAPPYSDF